VPMPPPAPPAAAATALPCVATVLATVGRVTAGIDCDDDTMGPTGRCGREIPVLLFVVEMLGDIVGRSDIDVGCDMTPEGGVADGTPDGVDEARLGNVVPTRKIWYCPVSVLKCKCPDYPAGMPLTGLKFCKVCSGTVI
jgi:hypothetical protein